MKAHLDTKRVGKRPRQESILSELRLSPAIRIRDLAARFAVSTETIRRDLDDLNERGLLSRTYGGAAGSPLVLEPNFDERRNTNVEERTAAAQSVSQLVHEGDVLMIDAGVTTIYVARRLSAEYKDLTVITNGFAVASALTANPGIRVMFCPGEFDGHEGGVSGEETIAFLRRFNASLAIVGASGLDEEGPTDTRTNSAWIKRIMVDRSDKAAVVIGKSKFGQKASHLICPMETLDFVASDGVPSSKLLTAISRAKVDLKLATVPLGKSAGR
ncbi:DeoR/GlpR transcriptional regulator [Bradyrhizobium tropiciagri]|uniref:DeoR/GlpR family DNA-binding transcription regulator n=1 Tax=Bradyrhizobium tropiciagri TaxID=312253 RepID=UPI001BA74CCA|nr:DeoR/GlpR family DNA-binding transcription regulator [Bradyrhizobium tropiciagri]MBR0898985.1 DeoR/GlpR transcriptional regulator [Bradyrhizobium tropiciagri]